jgi:urease subunit gamma/beta
MQLTPQERDRLLVAQGAELARRRLRRGARLGATEAAALIVDEVYEWAWDGVELSEVVGRARTILTPEQVLPGVPQMISHLQVDGLFPSGTYLIDIHDPIARPTDPVPSEGPPRELNVGRPRRQAVVTNESSRTVRVTSHADFSQVNPLLRVDDGPLSGWRLDIPAGSNESWAPGETREVTLVRWSATGDEPASREGDGHGDA